MNSCVFSHYPFQRKEKSKTIRFYPAKETLERQIKSKWMCSNFQRKENTFYQLEGKTSDSKAKTLSKFEKLYFK